MIKIQTNFYVLHPPNKYGIAKYAMKFSKNQFLVKVCKDMKIIKIKEKHSEQYAFNLNQPRCAHCTGNYPGKVNE